MRPSQPSNRRVLRIPTCPRLLQAVIPPVGLGSQSTPIWKHALALPLVFSRRFSSRRFSTGGLSVTRCACPLEVETLEVVDVYCEEGGPVKIHVKLPQNGSIKTFDRPRDQSLQKTLQRISLTLKKGPKKKGRGKFQQSWSEEKVENESEPELTGLFDEQGQQIDDVPLADAFTLKRAPTLLKLDGRQYRVRLNRPMVKGITCRGRPMAGHRLVPMGITASWNTEDLSRLRWEWRSSGKLLAKTRCFTPTQEEVGRDLEVIARPPLAKDERMSFYLGLDDEEAAACLVFDVVLEAPLPPSLAKERNQEMQRQKDSCKDGKQFRVISYNMLADSYRHFWDHIFPYCEPETLRPERRLQLCRQEVDAFNADILALQEVDAIWYKEYWQPQFETDGYSCCFTQKASDSGEGCLLLFRKKAFQLLELTELPLSQLPRTGVVQVPDGDVTQLSSIDSAVGALLGRLPELEDIFPRLGTVAQLVLLRSQDGERLILVCNTHLYYANYARHIRALQVALILTEAETITKRVEEEYGQQPALLFLGDLNSEPDTAATALLQKGYVSAAHPDWAKCASFCWGHASSRQAAKKMLAALKTGRPEAYSSLSRKDPGMDELRFSMERLQRTRTCLEKLGINKDQPEDVENDDLFHEELEDSMETSPWSALEQKLEARATFKTCAAVATAQLALDLHLSTEPVLKLEELDLDAIKHAADCLAQVVKEQMEYVVEKQRVLAEQLGENNMQPTLAGVGLQLHSPFGELTSACNSEFTNFVSNYEACLDWIFFSDSLEKVSEAPIPSREVLAAETALPSTRFPSDHILLAADFVWKKNSGLSDVAFADLVTAVASL